MIRRKFCCSLDLVRVMVKWCKKLYMDEEIKKEPIKWKKRIEEDKIPYGLFCIAFASNEKNLFDIIDCKELWFRHYRRNEIFIVGLARDRENSILLVKNIIEDIYEKTGGFLVREYFEFEES